MMAVSYVDTASKVSIDFGKIEELEKSVARLALDVGDTALAEGCVDVAAAVYGGLIKRFAGSEFTSYRHRAKLGLEKIEEIRN